MEGKELEEKTGKLPVASPGALPDRATVDKLLKDIEVFRALVRAELKEKTDYGTIPGTDKPTLYLPGAQKITKLLICRPEFEDLGVTEDWENNFFSYRIKCRLVSLITGQVVDQGIGLCHSRESKYAYRWKWPNEVSSESRAGLKTKTTKKKNGQVVTLYRVPNEDIADQANTLYKMAKKRAYVDAAISGGCLSELFTQDLEDLVEDTEFEETEEKTEETSAPLKTGSSKKASSGDRDTWETLVALAKELGHSEIWVVAAVEDRLGKPYTQMTPEEIAKAAAYFRDQIKRKKEQGSPIQKETSPKGIKAEAEEMGLELEEEPADEENFDEFFGVEK